MCLLCSGASMLRCLNLCWKVPACLVPIACSLCLMPFNAVWFASAEESKSESGPSKLTDAQAADLGNWLQNTALPKKLSKVKV